MASEEQAAENQRHAPPSPRAKVNTLQRQTYWPGPTQDVRRCICRNSGESRSVEDARDEQEETRGDTMRQDETKGDMKRPEKTGGDKKIVYILFVLNCVNS